MVFLLFFSKDFVPDFRKRLQDYMADDKGEYSEEEHYKSLFQSSTVWGCLYRMVYA